METKPQILCVGSVLWDIIGRAAQTMQTGADLPGRINRLPGGVAMNIAMALNGLGISAALLSAVGRDRDGDELIAAASKLGLITDFVYRSEELPTDHYLAIEGLNGLIAAIADAHSLEAAGEKILAALHDGRLASARNPWSGLVALDGNLSAWMLKQIAGDTLFDQADFRIAPASPGKAGRLNCFLGHKRATLYLNLQEASILCKRKFTETPEAALALLDKGLGRVLVTDGAAPATEARQAGAFPSVNFGLGGRLGIIKPFEI